MLIERRGNLRIVLVLTILLAFYLWTRGSTSSSTPADPSAVSTNHDDYRDVGSLGDQHGIPEPELPVIDRVEHDEDIVPEGDWNILYSRSTSDRKYFSVDLGGFEAYNPSIIPHPVEPSKWIVVAQDAEYRDDIGSSQQVVCVAEFRDGVLHCPKLPTALPISLSIEGKCEGEYAYTNMRRGPRDARVFYGPQWPYIMYGSQSYKSCLGLWIQNLWMLLDHAKHPPESFARGLTEIKRPKPWRQIEKNYFLFWDDKGSVYAHYDIYPKRVFAELRYDGSPMAEFPDPDGKDLAPAAADLDQKCFDIFPAVDPSEADIHQGTNSLLITMCNRGECTPTNDNTFVMHILQHKYTDIMKQIVYKPFPVLFRRTPPFNMVAVAQKPLYYHGNTMLTEKSKSRLAKMLAWTVPNGFRELMYTCSVSWKGQNQTYHGYLDDTLFLGFGIEDTRAAAIDVLASDILKDLAYCT